MFIFISTFTSKHLDTMVKLTQIQSIKDVETFTAQLVKEGINFHPDTPDFSEYVHSKTGENIYTLKEALLRNRLLTQCFAVCEKQSIDIYDICLEVFLKETGMHKFIPLPSTILES